VIEKVNPRGIDNSLPIRVALWASQPGSGFHSQAGYHSLETNPVYLVSTVNWRYFDVSLFIQAAVKCEMAGYSGTPLPQKLGIKPGMTVVIINAPTNYRRLLGTIPEGVTFSDRLKSDSNFVHVFIQKRSELEKRSSDLREKIADTGTVWVSWPKRSSGVPTDVTEDVVRAVALPLGFVDVKVCAIDQTWSGLKLMVRRTNRKRAARR
jgi:hypothetical protein